MAQILIDVRCPKCNRQISGKYDSDVIVRSTRQLPWFRKVWRCVYCRSHVTLKMNEDDIGISWYYSLKE